MRLVSVRIDEKYLETLKKRARVQTNQGAINWLIENERKLRSKITSDELKRRLKK